MAKRKHKTTMKPNTTNDNSECSKKLVGSEIGKLFSNKAVLRRYSAILKRKKNTYLTLQDLDPLQLELETLLLATIKRRKMLLEDYSVLEKELKVDYPDALTLKRSTTISNEQQNAPIAVLGPDYLKIIFPAPDISRRVSINEQHLTKVECESAKTLKPLLPPRNIEEVEQHENLGSSQATCFSELSSEKNYQAKSNKNDDPSAISHRIDDLDEGNFLGKKGLFEINKSKIFKQQMISIEENKTQEVKTGKKNVIDAKAAAILTTENENLKCSKAAAVATSENKNLQDIKAAAIVSSENKNLQDIKAAAKVTSENKNLKDTKATAVASSENTNLKEARTRRVSRNEKKYPKETKTRRVVKTGRSGGNTKTRTRQKASTVRYLEPSKKFWIGLNNIFRTISEPEIKALEELLKNYETMAKGLKEPMETGTSYPSRWAEIEMTQEKVAAWETSLSRKARFQTPGDVSSIFKGVEMYTDKETRSSSYEPNTLCGQIELALKKKKILHVNDTKCLRALQSERKTKKNCYEMETAIRRDLINAGIISDKNIVKSRQETEIDVKLQLEKNKSRALTKLTISELNRIIKLAKLEARKQNLHKQLINKGKEIEKKYQIILAHKKKGEPAPRQIKKALKLVLEREIILIKMENPNLS